MTHRISSSLRCRRCPLAGKGGGAVCRVWGGKEPRRRFHDGMNGSQDDALMDITLLQGQAIVKAAICLMFFAWSEDSHGETTLVLFIW
ncbi:hypothetical protein Q6Y00_003359 [Salmonella enterica]|nr:hypothetical protein [Salmonella enterica]EKB5319581.1 hypothetical protein [Salmonella enterica]ELK9207010.1 hypothetical protein [Salmonella enterica]ELK9220106.1 hypothetical protein [Salmonella enterica]ELK9221632.1 hypothetical protein [Salmonella enterica]